jgi:RimJ/RimL family protein N-acetyltransferase
MNCQAVSRHAGPAIIRRAQVTDTDEIVAGINEICAEGGAFYINRFVLNEQWQAVLYQPNKVPDHLLLIAEMDGRFAGSARLFPGQAHTLHRHVVELGLFVLKPYRRKGIGSQLLQAALNWAGKQQFEKITLSVFATNQPAISLYRQFGFKQEGCLVQQVKVDQDYVDLWLMARNVSQ